MEKYSLDPAFGISVDYWANSLQTFVAFDNLHSLVGGVDSEMDGNMNESQMITEDDLIVSAEGKTCLFLRFKNCTGNIIKLSEDQSIVDQ